MNTFIQLYLEDIEYLAVILINLSLLLNGLTKEKSFSTVIRFLSLIYFISCVYLIIKSKFEITHFVCLICLTFFLLDVCIKKRIEKA